MFDLKALINAHQGRQLELIQEHINPAFAKVLKTIGFDVHYVRGQGAYLWDDKGNRYIDCLGGYAVFNVGRNHPVVRQALKDCMDLDLPNLLKMGAYNLSGLLARELVRLAPGGPGSTPAANGKEASPSPLDTVFFTNSGAEAVETSLKYARAATGRPRLVHCEHSFHGLTLGALSVQGNAEFRDGFGPLIQPCTQVPFNDIAALERELAKGDVAAFIVEPIQGKGVYVANDDYLPAVRELCTKYGTIFIADEVQTGFGRTGKMFACEHWNVVPDIMATAKGLSGGYVPVGAAISRRWIHNKVFSSLDRCVVHSTTFGQNDMAMAAGLAALHVLREEKIVENSAAMGDLLMSKLRQRLGKHEMVKEIRGKGLLIAIEFQPPRPASLMLRMQWAAIHKLDASLFPQAILMPLLSEHHILAQTAGHHMDVIKLIPPLVVTEQDVEAVAAAFDAVVANCHRLSGPMWEVGRRLGAAALKRGMATQPAGT